MVDVGDPNLSNCSTDILSPNQKWVLLVVGCNLEKNFPSLSANTKIIIDSKQYEINRTTTNYEGELKFGREPKIKNNIDVEADIKFDESDLKISRNQFSLLYINSYLFIKCLIDLRKPPTLIRITQTEIYLEKENIITFGKKNSLTFRVCDIFIPAEFREEKPSIKLQLVSLNPVENGKMYQSFVMYYNGKKIIGSDGFMDSSNLELYNVVLGYNMIKKKWYLFEKEKTAFGNASETFVYLFKYNEIKWGKEPSVIDSWTKLEEDTVINVGEYYLKVNKA